MSIFLVFLPQILIGDLKMFEDENEDADLYCYDFDQEFEYDEYLEGPRTVLASSTQVCSAGVFCQ